MIQGCSEVVRRVRLPWPELKLLSPLLWKSGWSTSALRWDVIELVIMYMLFVMQACCVSLVLNAYFIKINCYSLFYYYKFVVTVAHFVNISIWVKYLISVIKSFPFNLVAILFLWAKNKYHTFTHDLEKTATKMSFSVIIVSDIFTTQINL